MVLLVPAARRHASRCYARTTAIIPPFAFKSQIWLTHHRLTVQLHALHSTLYSMLQAVVGYTLAFGHVLLSLP